MSKRVRIACTLRGVVQGVGFRPHVAATAARYAVTGKCGNDDLSVFIEAQGEREIVTTFLDDVRENIPPLARIISEERREIALVDGETEFSIVASEHLPGARTLLPPDTAICIQCAKDIHDPKNRRYRYPFTTCTHCGPRLTIITDLPYDRPLTTMVDFPLCPACQHEYSDIHDRRFHAQPISCWDCGPKMWISTPENPGMHLDADQHEVLKKAANILAQGKILAILGLGGYHLAVNARDPQAVARLRERKGRGDKPFAIMCASLAVAETLVRFSEAAQRELTGQAHPIVIAPIRRPSSRSKENAHTQEMHDVTPDGHVEQLRDAVAPGLNDIGVMLPYTPMHMLLFDELAAIDPHLDALVMTSGNRSGEPLIYQPEGVEEALGHIADAFLSHNRRIQLPVEDSVLEDSPEEGILRPIRRSRGYAPLPIFLEETDSSPVVLASGAEMKNTTALTRQGMVFLSSHVGEMGSLASLDAHRRAVASLEYLNREKPELIVVDAHPSYYSSAEGISRAHAMGIEYARVQHHYAHALSLLAEHNLLFDDPRIGEQHKGVQHTGAQHTSIPVATIDGTGYGTDGAIWGGEILLVHPDRLGWDRAWHVPEFALVGGDSAVKNPWKVACGIWESWKIADEFPENALSHFLCTPRDFSRDDPSVSPLYATSALSRELPEESLVSQMQKIIRAQRMNATCTSLGRVFDAVSAFLGICEQQTYEGQAAMELEACAHRWYMSNPECFQKMAKNYAPQEIRDVLSNVLFSLYYKTEPTNIECGIKTAGSIGYCAALFHIGIARVLANELARLAHLNHSSVVGLTGGAACNRLLARILAEFLSPLTLLEHTRVPATDGGLALGQAVFGYVNLRKASICA